MIPRFSIGKFQVSCVNLQTAVDYIKSAIAQNKSGYICVSNSRSAYDSNVDDNYCMIQNNSLLTVPDGRPISWIAHNLGYTDVEQIAGNDLFHRLLSVSKEEGYSHYFYGSTEETIDAMSKNMDEDYPDVELKGACSPPFQPLEDYDIDGLANEINELKPTFLWIGLGAPKQEKLMALLQPKLKETICIGVGLVFEYYAGNVTRAPKLIRRIGLEWLFRDIQQKRKRNPPFSVIFKWTIKQLIYSKIYKKTSIPDR